ncbi:uncharacterized protein LOC143018966 [Oratosquilla oratoria]|uniref:uncharacterized protein LOC143018966 n=1 Tax=Oratosquilla oratoria TaxID=337810 RepID=UPI003F759A85
MPSRVCNTSTKERVETHKCIFPICSIEAQSLAGFSCGTDGLVVKSKSLGTIPQNSLMNMALTGLIGRAAFVYMDGHLKNLEDVLARLRSVNLSLKLEKCDFFKGEIIWDFTNIFVLNTNASDFAIGGVLQQPDENGHRRPISFFSRTLNDSERKYSAAKKEALTVYYGLTVNRPLILGFPLIVYIPGRENIVADALSRIREADHPIDTCIVSSTTKEKERSAQARSTTKEKERSAQARSTTKEKERSAQNPDEIVQWDSNEMRSKQKQYRVVVPDHFIETALHLAHCLPLSGHGGHKVTLERLRKFAFWMKMDRDVKTFVKRCSVCAKCKPSWDSPAPLQQFPDVLEKLERAHVDVVEPFPTTSEGYKYNY